MHHPPHTHHRMVDQPTYSLLSSLANNPSYLLITFDVLRHDVMTHDR